MKKINDLIDFCTIPGLEDGAIPQGICFSKKNNILIISCYFKKNKPSSLYIVDFKTKETIKKIELKNIDNTDYLGHVGGLATNDKYLWITDNYKVLVFSLDKLLTDNCYYPDNIYEIENKADNASFSNNTLFIGEYNYKKRYKTRKEHHIGNNESLLFCYKNIEQINFDKPDYIVSIPNRVQGIVQDSENNFYLSRSFWSFQDSEITIAKNVVFNSYYKINNNEIPLYIIKEENIVDSIILPPMSEGIEIVDNNIYILFESGSKLYRRYTLNRTDKIKIYNI